MVAGPIVLTSANRSGQPPATTAEEAVDALGDDVALVLDGGPCRFGEASSVVRVRGNEFEMLREGVVGLSTLRRLSRFMILFVCTGNTCRSPMAEVLARHMLADRLKCSVDQLEDRGFLVQSAGMAAGYGGSAAMKRSRL